MRQRHVWNFATVATIFAIPILAFLVSLIPLSPIAPPQPSKEELDATMALVDRGMSANIAVAASKSGQGASEIKQAAPIDAPLTDSKASGGAASSGAPIRTIDPSAVRMGADIDKTFASKGNDDGFGKTVDGKFFKVSFTDLASYRYVEPEGTALEALKGADAIKGKQIPERIKKLDDEQVVVVGFMVPIDITRDETVKRFALTQNQGMCCYGVAPKLNEWIMVNVSDEASIQPCMDMPIAVFGKLEVGEEIQDNYVASLYRMTTNEVINAVDLLRRTQGTTKNPSAESSQKAGGNISKSNPSQP